VQRSIIVTLSLPLSVPEDIDASAKKNNTPRSWWLRDAALARLSAEAAAPPAPPTQANRNAALDLAFAQFERERQQRSDTPAADQLS
jgi:hypothetical protein